MKLSGSSGVSCVYQMPFSVGTAIITSNKIDTPIRPISTSGLPWPCEGIGRSSLGRSRNLIIAKAKAPPTAIKMPSVTHTVSMNKSYCVSATGPFVTKVDIRVSRLHPPSKRMPVSALKCCMQRVSPLEICFTGYSEFVD